MSTPARKFVPSGDPSNRLSMAEGTATNGVTPRSSSKSPNALNNGLQRSPSARVSPMSARAAARKPGRSALSVSNIPKMTNDTSEEDARAENAALIEELKEQLHKAETVSEQYLKQLEVLQMRLDDAILEQGKLESQAHEKDSKIDTLNAEMRDHARQIRDLERVHETERNAMLSDKESQACREEELQGTIQRLKESLAQKEMRMNAETDKNMSRSSSFRNRSLPDGENGQFAPSSHLERSPSRNNAMLLLQKDKLIESLRLELAESQNKLVEMENRGGGRQQELERELLDARMANARLMEDNESYQLLLSEKTLNGDFMKGEIMNETTLEDKQAISGPGSLADELESVGEGSSGENTWKLEPEIKSLKDENKALTLYIEKIVGRVLQYEGFESILDKNDTPEPSQPNHTKTDKELPPIPSEKDEQAEQTSLIQRAKSAMTGQNNRPKPKPRPSNFVAQPPAAPTPHENPETAPSIPLTRSHRRTRSELATDGTVAAVVGQMYRGPPGARNPSNGPGMSPTTMGPGSRQSSFFSGTSYVSNVSAGGRASSQSSQPDRKRFSSDGSTSSDTNGEVSSTGANSTPPNRNSAGLTTYTGAVMTQNKLRPLRLVQENQEFGGGYQGGFKTAAEEEAARRKMNRGSWISWLNRPKEEDSIKT